MDNEILQKIQNQSLSASGLANPSSDEDEKVDDLIKNAPPRTKEVYFAPSTADEIYKAAQESGMKEDLIPKASFLLGDLLLGILDPKDFSFELMNFGVPEAVAINFYRIISQSLLLKIKDELDQLYSPPPVKSAAPKPQPSEPAPPENVPPQASVKERPIQPSPESPPVSRIKIEPPPIRKIPTYHFEEEKKEAETVKSQVQTSDKYREPIDNLVDLTENK